MKKLTLFITLTAFAYHGFCMEYIDMNKPPTNEQHYDVLVAAVVQHECRGNLKAYNKNEHAVGAFQIRPIRVRDYNIRRGTHYKLSDFYNYELAREMFLYYARGKSFQKAAKDWNGSGPMVIQYWQQIKNNLMQIALDYNPKSYDAYKLMHEGILALARAEQQGFRIDLDYLQKKRSQLEKKAIVAEERFKETDFYKEWQDSTTVPVNINSSTHLGKFLYDVKGIKIPKTTVNGKWSTDAEALSKLDIPEFTDFYKEKTRLKKALDIMNGLDREQIDGVLHPFYNLHLVRTFRSSSDSINFQNIPKRDKFLFETCRRAIYPRKGHQFMEIDFSGAEVRISACYNHDPKLISYVKDPATDMHGDMAQQLFKFDKFDKSVEGIGTLRQAAKNGFVFPQFYGDYYKNCAVNLACNWGKLPEHGKWKPGQGIKIGDSFLSDHLIKAGFKELGRSEKVDNKWVTTGFIKHVQDVEKDFWGNRFKVYSNWKNDQWDLYQKYGYVELYTGFRCGGVMNKKDAINYPIQGTAFHCLLWSFIQMDKRLRETNMDTRLIGQIHDSMILDVHPAEVDHVYDMAKKIISRDLRKHWDWICVPMDADAEICPVDGSWAEKEKYKE